MHSQPSRRWHTYSQHVYACHEDGAHFAYDFFTGETWQLTEPAADLLTALRAGWQPGRPVPALVARHLGPEDGGTEIAEALVDLSADGLVTEGEEPPEIPAVWAARVHRSGWRDLRLRIAQVGPLPARLAAAVQRMLRFAPLFVAGTFSLALWLFFGNVQAEAASTWDLFASHTGPVERILVSLLGVFLLLSVHELGHALAMTAVTGQPVTVGLRLFNGLPQGYADISASILLPERSRRIGILLGGVALESLFWLALVPWALYAAAPPLVYTMLRFGGAFTIIGAFLPLVENDGYFLLQELTRRRDLMEASEAEAARLLVEGEQPVRWLAFFWLLRVHAVALLLAVGGMAVGRVAEAPLALGSLGSVLALVFLGRHYIRVTRAAYRLRGEESVPEGTEASPAC